MRESQVVGYVREWLRRLGKPLMYEDRTNVDLFIAKNLGGSIFMGTELSWLIILEQIECKGTTAETADVHRAIGQCLDYYLTYYPIPTYIAVPDDYRQLRRLREITDHFHLPIGIILVSQNGEISIDKPARGKPHYYKWYYAASGDITIRLTHPKRAICS